MMSGAAADIPQGVKQRRASFVPFDVILGSNSISQSHKSSSIWHTEYASATHKEEGKKTSRLILCWRIIEWAMLINVLTIRFWYPLPTPFPMKFALTQQSLLCTKPSWWFITLRLAKVFVSMKRRGTLLPEVTMGLRLDYNYWNWGAKLLFLSHKSMQMSQKDNGPQWLWLWCMAV